MVLVLPLALTGDGAELNYSNGRKPTDGPSRES